MPRKVFISYHREDAKWQAREIYRALARVLPRDHVFIDIDEGFGPLEDAVEDRSTVSLGGNELVDIPKRSGGFMSAFGDEYMQLDYAPGDEALAAFVKPRALIVTLATNYRRGATSFRQ